MGRIHFAHKSELKGLKARRKHERIGLARLPSYYVEVQPEPIKQPLKLIVQPSKPSIEIKEVTKEVPIEVIREVTKEVTIEKLVYVDREIIKEIKVATPFEVEVIKEVTVEKTIRVPYIVEKTPTWAKVLLFINVLVFTGALILASVR